MLIRDTILENKILPPEPYIYPMSAVRDEELFRYFLDKYIKETIIIETGSYCGLSSIVLSSYSPIVHTFDIVDYPERKKVWKYFNVNRGKITDDPHIVFHKIKDNTEKEKILFNMNPLDNVFAFLDGHHKNGVDKDFEMFRMYGCKKFLFHDYNPEKCTGGDGLYDWMKNYLDSIKGNAKIVEAKPPFIYMEFE